MWGRSHFDLWPSEFNHFIFGSKSIWRRQKPWKRDRNEWDKRITVFSHVTMTVVEHKVQFNKPSDFYRTQNQVLIDSTDRAAGPIVQLKHRNLAVFAEGILASESPLLLTLTWFVSLDGIRAAQTLKSSRAGGVCPADTASLYPTLWRRHGADASCRLGSFLWNDVRPPDATRPRASPPAPLYWLIPHQPSLLCPRCRPMRGGNTLCPRRQKVQQRGETEICKRQNLNYYWITVCLFFTEKQRSDFIYSTSRYLYFGSTTFVRQL